MCHIRRSRLLVLALVILGIALGLEATGVAQAQLALRDVIRGIPGYDLVISWGNHATLQVGVIDNPPPAGGMMTYNDLIEVDPVGNYTGLNYPTTILVTDIHPDHFDPAAIARRKTGFTTIIAPAAAKLAGATVMANGETKTFERVTIEAVPMYNLTRGPAAGQLYHDKGRGNGYIITVVGKRIYVAGDTECTPEMKALKNIDIAFVPMNVPYTMPPSEAAECVKAFKPKIVYPYHYQGSDPKQFAAALNGTGIDVRVRDWYPPAPKMTAVPLPAAPTRTATNFNPPRLPDGQPDIRGFWGGGGASVYSLEDPIGDRDEHVKLGGQDPNGRNVIVDPPDGKIPYQPSAMAKRNELHDRHVHPRTVEEIDPVVRCFLAGVPRLNYGGGHIMQIPGYVIFLVEYPTSTYRVVPIDAGPHVGENIKLWNGDARGRWEGNTLVIETTNHNDRTWFDIVGDFHSDALKVTERWTLVDSETVDYSATLEDPKVFARPWTMAFTRKRTKDPDEQWESASCAGNRAVEVILGLDWK